MSDGWSPSDKSAAKNLARKAKSSAEARIIGLARSHKLACFDDLWELEKKINGWRSVYKHAFRITYAKTEADICCWLKEGWLEVRDLDQFSEERADRIRHLHKGK